MLDFWFQHRIGPLLCGVQGQYSNIFRKQLYTQVDQYDNENDTDIIDNSTAESIFTLCERMHIMRTRNPQSFESRDHVSKRLGVSGLSALRLMPGLVDKRPFFVDMMHCNTDIIKHVFSHLKGRKAFEITVNDIGNQVAKVETYITKEKCIELDSMYV